MSISPLKTICNSDKGSTGCSPIADELNESKSRSLSFKRILPKSGSFKKKFIEKASKSVKFSGLDRVIEVESHSLYSETERQNTWYDSNELIAIKKNVRSQLMLLPAMSSISTLKKTAYNGLLDDLISLKFSGIHKQSFHERKYIVVNILRQQEERKRKSLKKKKGKTTDLSLLYSSLVVNHKDIAQQNAIKAAAIADKIYIEDGLLRPAPKKDSREILMSEETKENYRNSTRKRRFFCLRKRSPVQ